MLYANGHYSFEEFVDATNRARSIDHLCEIMVEAAAHLGFDRINFSVIRDRSLPPANLGFGKISTYTEEWRAHYASYDLQKIDPVVRFASARFGPFRWRDIERQGGLSRRQIAFFRDGEEAGLHNGVGLPFSGNDDVIGGIALATSFRGTMHLRNLDVLAAFGNQFYNVYKRLAGVQPLAEPIFAVLTEREHEVLVRVAQGQSDLEIALGLDIRPRTVDFHLTNIYQKFGAKNRPDAVAIGFRLGFLR